MAESYVLLEDKKLLWGGLSAVPEHLYHSSLEVNFNRAGTLEGLLPSDFSEKCIHGHNLSNFPIYLVGKLRNIHPERDEIRRRLEGLSYPLDPKSIAHDISSIDRVLGHQLLSGDLYLVRFDGENRYRPEAYHWSEAYLVEASAEFTARGKTVKLNGESQQLPGHLGSVLKHDGIYRGRTRTVKLGSVTLHRKSFDPYGIGDSGQQYVNPPCVIRLDHQFVEDEMSRATPVIGNKPL